MYFFSFGDHRQLGLIKTVFFRRSSISTSILFTPQARKPTSAKLLLVLDSLVSSRAVVVEEGVLVARKSDGERRLLLNIELKGVLMGD
jgi:hypothetical protein